MHHTEIDRARCQETSDEKVTEEVGSNGLDFVDPLLNDVERRLHLTQRRDKLKGLIRQGSEIGFHVFSIVLLTLP